MLNTLLSKDSIKATGIFLVVLLILFSAVFFKGYIFSGGDTTAAKGMTEQLNIHLRETGEYPLWQPFIFSGMPAFSSHMFTKWVYFPNILLTPLFAIGFPALWVMLLHYILAALGMYYLLKSFKVSFWAAILAGLAYMLMPFFVVMMSAGHGSQMMTAAYLPWLLYAVRRIFLTPDLKGFFLLALIAGLQFQRGHVQVAYYGWMAAGWYVVIEAIFRAKSKNWEKFLPALAYLAGGLILGIGLAAVLYIPSLSYAAHSIRGGGAGGGLEYGYATSWSLPPYETLALLFSDWFGFGGQTYWGGRPFTEHTDYLGFTLVFLAFFAFANKDLFKEKVFLASAIFLGLLVSFGSYWPLLYDLLFKLLPFFNKFRVPSMIMILVELLVAVLAGLGLHALMNVDDERRLKLSQWSLYALIASGTLFLLTLLVKGGITGLYQTALAGSAKAHPQLAGVREDMFYASLIKGLAMASLTLALIWAYLSQRIQSLILGLGLTLLVVVDLGHVDLRFTANASSKTRVEAAEQETPAIRKLKELTQADPGRIMPAHQLFGSNIWALYGLESIGGYSPAKLKVLQDFLDATRLEQTFLPKYYEQSSDGATPKNIANVDPVLRKRHLDVLRTLNVRYVVSPYPLNEPLFELLDRPLHLIRGQRSQVYIYRFLDSYPRAWFVKEMHAFETSREVTLAMNRNEKPLSKHAFVLDPEDRVPDYDITLGQATLIEKSYHTVTISTKNTGSGFLVVSEVYYPGWKASIDGEEVHTFQTNELIRGVLVPAGEHTVTFTYAPPAVRTGFLITLVSTLLLIALGAWLLYQHRKDNTHT